MTARCERKLRTGGRDSERGRQKEREDGHGKEEAPPTKKQRFITRSSQWANAFVGSGIEQVFEVPLGGFNSRSSQ